MSVIQDITNTRLVAIVQSDTTVINPPLKRILILAAGDLRIVTEAGITHTITFPAAAAGGSYPFYLEGLVKQVHDTGTTLTDAQVFGQL